jgi:hypothetical protein
MATRKVLKSYNRLVLISYIISRLTSGFVTSDNKKFYKKFQKNFRTGFRTPYSHVLELIRMAKDSDLLKRRWLGFNAVGKESLPIRLMVSGALCYLGRG